MTQPIRHARTRWARSQGASRAGAHAHGDRCGFGAPARDRGMSVDRVPVDCVDRIGKTDLVQPARAPAP